MSSRPPESPDVGRRPTLPSLQPRIEPVYSVRSSEHADHQQRGRGARPASVQPTPWVRQSLDTGLPPLLHSDERSSTPSRGLGVHNILNPPQFEQNTRVGTIEIGASHHAPPTPSPAVSVATLPSFSHPGRPQASTAFQQIGQERYGERAQGMGLGELRSPRSVSLGGRAASDARYAPLVPGRTILHAENYPREVSGIATQPTPMRASMSSAPDHRRSSVAGPTSASQTTSPSLSINSGFSQASPAGTQSSQHPSGMIGPYQAASSYPTARPEEHGGPGQGRASTEGPFPPERLYVSGTQASQSNVRLMPLTGPDGVQFYMPVEVQAASRVADEKRARNAGASARFRERRKMKEREANSAIQKLEREARDLERKIRELEGEREFYRGERDRYRDIIFRTPSIRNLAMQAPPSPRLSTGRAPPRASQSTVSYSGQPGGMPHEVENVERPARRRKTETQMEYTYAAPQSTGTPSHVTPREYGQADVEEQKPILPPLRLENVATAGSVVGAPAGLGHHPIVRYHPSESDSTSRGR